MTLQTENLEHSAQNSLLEARAQEIGLQIFALSAEHKMSLFDKGFWSGKMMEWSMKYPSFKVEMFRFVDVLPTLHSSEQVAEHLRQYFLRPELEFPAVIRAGLGMATSNGLTARLAAASIRKNVVSMASTFITGTDAASARKQLKRLWDSGFCFTVDILGEAAIAESEAEDYQRRYLNLVEGLSREVRPWNNSSTLEVSPLGSIPRANVSVKCSSLYSQIDVLDFRGSVEAIKTRLRPILQAALKNSVFVNLDLEQNDFREIIQTVAEEIFCEDEFKSYPHFGLVVQAYLKSAQADITRVLAFAKTRAAPVTVRLVKGAYWDYEVIQSSQRGWPVPVFTQKAQTDANYERCTDLMFDAYPYLLSAFGSHNVRNLAYALASAENRGLAKTSFEVQMLFGMAEPFKAALSKMGFRVREYAPVGEMLPGMAYLVRRLLENTSNEGFLRAKFVSKEASKVLLENPLHKIRPQIPHKELATMFQNEALRDFSKPENRAEMAAAVEKVRKLFPLKVPTVVDSKIVENLPATAFFNPSQLKEHMVTVSESTTQVAESAVQACKLGAAAWAARSVAERSGILRSAANIMRARKSELAALMCLEVGKNFREADGDVAEAIDFCDYYAQEMDRLSKPQSMGSSPGESNHYLYRARGLAIAIAPWNFPLAILCGLTVAPLVAGNPVIMKPSEQSSGIGFWLYNILREAGVPGNVLQFVTGKGSVVGEYLVSHPKVHIVNFTGSRTVGLHILEETAKVRPGQRHIKRAVVELGGKNAIIVDDDADLDEAVTGSIKSAYGFAGQKCSALSRLIVHASCYDKFKSRFVEAMKSISIGAADDVGAGLGPVVDAASQKRLLEVLARNKTKVAGMVEVPAKLLGAGHYAPAVLFEETDFHSELGQNEFFGPFVTLFKVASFDEALAAMNDVDYALTGGIFSRSPKNLERARREIEVGNLYINRGCTGALVFKQPFGGFKLSGAGGKAGGPDYLLNFLEPVTHCENTMRRGFAPEIGT